MEPEKLVFLDRFPNYKSLYSPIAQIPFIVRKEDDDILSAGKHYGECLDNLSELFGENSSVVRSWFSGFFAESIEIDKGLRLFFQHPILATYDGNLVMGAIRSYINTLLNINDSYLPFLLAYNRLKDPELMLDILSSSIDKEQFNDALSIISHGVVLDNPEDQLRCNSLRTQAIRLAVLDLLACYDAVNDSADHEKFINGRKGLLGKGKFIPEEGFIPMFASELVHCMNTEDLVDKSGPKWKLNKINAGIFELALDGVPHTDEVRDFSQLVKYLYAHQGNEMGMDRQTFAWILQRSPRTLRRFGF